MNKATHNSIHIFTSLLLLSVLPLAASSDSSVTNSISVSSNTGGNNANGGEVVTGSTKTSVKIHTTVNGETITDINKEYTNDSEHTVIIQETTEIPEDNTLMTKSVTTIVTQNATESEEHSIYILGSEHHTAHFILPHIITSYSKTMAYVLSQLY